MTTLPSGHPEGHRFLDPKDPISQTDEAPAFLPGLFVEPSSCDVNAARFRS
jgi:hypothetical protein